MKFVAMKDDSIHGQHWSVWNMTENGSPEYTWAEFHGPNAMRYAREHAKRLNKGGPTR